MFKEAEEELIKYLLKTAPYQENSIKEILRINKNRLNI